MKIKVYSKPKCAYCNKAKEYLQSNYIEYEEINLAEKERRDDRDFYRSLGVSTLPVIVVDVEGTEFIYYGDKSWEKVERHLN